MARTAEQWGQVLAAMGVEQPEIETWAPIMASVIQDDTFSAGDEEIDDFLGEVAHESNKFSTLEEGLTYKSAERIQKVFGTRRFPRLTDALACVRNPRALALKAYGGEWGRMHLGNTEPNDGWDMRGSGLIQATGRDNIAKLAATMGYTDVVAFAELLRTDPEVALRASILWWEGHVPDAFVNQPAKQRRVVNGPAALGLEDVEQMSDAAKGAM